MLLTAILIVLASILSGITFYFGGYYENMFWIWMPFVLALAFFWALFLLYALCVAYYAHLIKRFGKPEYAPSPRHMYLLSQLCFVCNIFFRVRFHASGLGKVPTESKFMLVSNHLSGFDHVGLISIFPHHRIVFVHKEGISKIILAGGLIRRAGYLSIKQNDVLSGTKVIEKAGQYIKDGICSVGIAPEGTRNKDFPSPEVLPFHPGSFQMAYDSHCPIVIFAIQNTNCILKRWPFSHTDVYFDCVGVIEYEDYKDLSSAELAEKARSFILRRFEQKNARFYHLKPKKEEKAE